MRNRRGLAVLVVWAVLASAPDVAFAAAVPKATCRPGDRPETALQGQVPWGDRLSGRAALGYSCSLRQVGGFGAVNGDPSHAKLSGWANFDTYENCAYYGDGNNGTIVLDVSDPTRPVQTAYLDDGAMTGPWESLRVNAARGLLVADHQPNSGGSDAPGASPFDVYDVSKDCAHPRKLFSGALPHAVGHEGWFQPDGMVYYAADFNGQVVPIDLSDPRNPRELAVWQIAAHGGSVSDDGNRGYFCISNEVLVVDTSEVQARRPNAKFREIATIPLPDTTACQETYPVTYNGHPYLIQFGEIGENLGPVCPTMDSTYSRPHIIDMADERRPKVVAELMNEVALPENCPRVAGDRSSTPNQNGRVPYAVFMYGTHMCHPDRLHDPTILACAEFLSGVRVYDIRDPRRAKEIAYFNTGTLSRTDPTVDMAANRPVIKPDRGEIWYSTVFGGFHVLKFADGVYPFDEALTCPRRPDRFVAQYNRTAAAQCSGSGGGALGLSAPRHCVSRRNFVIRLHGPRGQRLRSARVYVNGKRVRVRRRGKRFRARIDLRGFARRVVRVRVVAVTRRGRRVVEVRRYRTCAKRRTTGRRFTASAPAAARTSSVPAASTLTVQGRSGPSSASAPRFACRLAAGGDVGAFDGPALSSVGALG